MTRGSILRMDLPQAVILALLIHLLLVLLGAARPDWLPFRLALPEAPPPPEPMRFEFVDLPDERPGPETPPERAPASDRTRRAASPSPPEPVPPSPDPYSEGNTAEKMAYDPSPQVPREPGRDAQAPAGSPADEGRQAERQTEAPAASEDGGERRSEDEARKIQALVDATKPYSLRELGQRYDNIAAPANADFGAVSFDTIGVDWGEYAQEMLEIIRRNWIERLPPAFQAGLRGRSVVSFRIAPDGTVSTITLLDGSGVPPYDRVAGYAIEASNRLPPLPPEFLKLGKDDVGVTIEFYYNLRPPPR